MKKQKTIQKLTPREAAKNFILPFVMKGDTIYLLPSHRLLAERTDYTAQIEGKNILITKLYGVDINEKFPLYDIIDEAFKECFKKVKTGKTTKESYEELEQDIKILLKKLSVKLRNDKKQFKLNPENWRHIGNIGQIAEVLKDIAE